MYVQKAKSEGFRARSVYKLQEINERYGIIRKGITIVDLGAAPGSWSQYMSEILDGNGKIFAVDILPMQSLQGVTFINLSIESNEIIPIFQDILQEQKIELVLSDIAPNLSGVKIIDQTKIFQLAENSLQFAQKFLAPNGILLIKLFQGNGYVDFCKKLKKSFNVIKILKPKASQKKSKEIFLLAFTPKHL